MTLEILLSRPVYAIAEENVASMASREADGVVEEKLRVDGVKSGRRVERDTERTYASMASSAAIKLHVTNRVEMATRPRRRDTRCPPGVRLRRARGSGTSRVVAARVVDAAAAYAKSDGGFGGHHAEKGAEKL